MANFMFAYHGGKKPDSPEEGAKLKEEWNAWVDGLGDAAVNRGTPVGMSKTVSSDGITDGGGSNPIMGFSVIAADSIEAACDLAKACPHLKIGTIEIAEMFEM